MNFGKKSKAEEKTMKILVESFCENESGPVLAHDIAVGLKNNGIDVYCLITNKMENYNDWIDDIDKDRIFLWNGTPSKKKILKTISNLISLLKFFIKKEFDYVLLTNPAKIDLLVSKFISYKENIMILHDVIPHSSTQHQLNDYVFEVVSKSDNILIMSKLFLKDTIERYNKKIENIFYMRHGLMMYPMIVNKSLKKYEKNDINFLYFGRIDGYKGLHILSKAFKKLSKDFDNITLTIAGGGDFSEYQKEFMNLDRVEIINKYISDSEIAEIFSRPRTVLVLPYLDATQSGVIGVGFNYLTPIIASDTGGIKEQLFDGKVGLLVRPGEVEDLYHKMKEMIESQEIYRNQKELMKKYKKMMSWDYITRDLINQLENHNYIRKGN